MKLCYECLFRENTVCLLKIQVVTTRITMKKEKICLMDVQMFEGKRWLSVISQAAVKRISKEEKKSWILDLQFSASMVASLPPPPPYLGDQPKLKRGETNSHRVVQKHVQIQIPIGIIQNTNRNTHTHLVSSDW